MAKKRKVGEPKEPEYEFVPPEFDEKEYIYKDLYGTKVTIICAVLAVIVGICAGCITNMWSWLGGLLHGDMGVSYVTGRQVFPTFIAKLPATLLLTAVSILLTVVISIPLGILAAVRQNRLTDRLIRAASFFGSSMPGFFVATAKLR